MGIIPSEQINRDLHQRLSEIFPRKHEGCSEHPGCKNSIENEHDEEPVIMRDEGSRVEACSHPKCMSSLTHMSWDIKIQAVLQ